MIYATNWNVVCTMIYQIYSMASFWLYVFVLFFLPLFLQITVKPLVFFEKRKKYCHFFKVSQQSHLIDKKKFVGTSQLFNTLWRWVHDIRKRFIFFLSKCFFFCFTKYKTNSLGVSFQDVFSVDWVNRVYYNQIQW